MIPTVLWVGVDLGPEDGDHCIGFGLKPRLLVVAVPTVLWIIIINSSGMLAKRLGGKVGKDYAFGLTRHASIASCSLTTTICPNSHAHNLPEHSSPPPPSAIPPSGLPKTSLKRERGAMGRPSSNTPLNWANDTEATYFSPPQTPPTPPHVSDF